MATSGAITCTICDEVYNLEESKPLLLPCSHTFCSSCIQQMQSINNKRCPVCRGSWAGQAVDSLPVIRQLAESFNKKTMTKVQSTGNQNICDLHNDDLNAWCKTCNVTACIQCLKDVHKSCDWISIKKKTTELMRVLDKTVVSTRTTLIEKFARTTTESNSLLIEVTENIKKMQRYEKLLRSFLKKLPIRQNIAMSKLEKFETTLLGASVNELTTAISNIPTLIDDPITMPRIPKIVVPDCEEPNDDSDSDYETAGEVAAHSYTASTSSGMVRP